MDPADIPVSTPGAARRFPRSRRLQQGLGYLFAAACLVWVFHDYQLTHLTGQLANLRWGWICLAVAVDILGYVSQGLRWQLLLQPVGSLSVMRTTQAIYVGLFANELLPMRIGEVVRAYLVSQWLRVKLMAVVPSLIVERFFDGVWLAVGMGLAAILLPLPKDLLEAGDILGSLLLAGTGFFVYLILRRQHQRPAELSADGAGRTFASRARSFVNQLASAFRTLGTSAGFYLALGLSIVLLVFQALALWAVMQAYGLRLPFWEGMVVLLVLHLGTAIPNAPANVGTYQFFTVMGLALFGVDKQSAAGFSVVAFVVLTIPLWAIGSLALSRTGLSFASLRQEARKLLARSE